MTQDTRKDPRAKIVSLNVRYKSATVDEFIENHSHDVSRGGIFIKTATPFPQGTLLKFEIRLSGDQAVIAGVGRVVWKRESGQSANERPAGMGVKFIKIDESSRAVIDRLVNARADAGSAFTSELAGGELLAAQKGPGPSVKRTIMGMGATPPPPLSESRPPRDASLTSTAAGGFFPPTSGAADMPPPQERTMMKQAAELLEEALKEAGGSMDEVGSNPLFAGPVAGQQAPAGPPPVEPKPIVAVTPPPAHASLGAGAPVAGDAPPAPLPRLPPLEEDEDSRLIVVPPPGARAPSTPAPRSPSAPPSQAQAMSAVARVASTPPAEKKSSGAAIGLGIAALLVVGGGLVAYKSGVFGGGQPVPSATAVPDTVPSALPTASAPPVPIPIEDAAAVPEAVVDAAVPTPTATPDAAAVRAVVDAAVPAVPVTPRPRPRPPASSTAAPDSTATGAPPSTATPPSTAASPSDTSAPAPTPGTTDPPKKRGDDDGL